MVRFICKLGRLEKLGDRGHRHKETKNISNRLLTEPPELTPMSFGKEISIENDFGQLVCTVIRGDSPFSFTWSLQGAIVNSEPGLSTSQFGGRSSMLMIDSIGHRHSGKYTCTVSNVAGQVSESTELKVNG